MIKTILLKVRTFIFIAIYLLVVVSCSSKDERRLSYQKELYNRFENNLNKPVKERIQLIPPDMMKAVINFDESLGMKNTNYHSRELLPQELTLFLEYISLLPAKFQSTVSNKLIAVFVVDGFSGAALVDWVIDDKGQLYYYLVINSEVFTQSLDEWLTFKSNSIFEKTSESPMIKVRSQTNYKALMYVLLHEIGHIVDYEYVITPYVDPIQLRKMGANSSSTDFTRGVWTNQTEPIPTFDFIKTADFNLYGMYKDKELISSKLKAEWFHALTKTPFVSFYSAVDWNQDFSDSITYYHIEKKLNGKMTLEMYEGDKLIATYLPVTQGLTNKKIAILESLYGE